MRRLILPVIVLLMTVTAIAQNADFTAISALNTIAERRGFMHEISAARKSALIQFHIDEKRSQWAANSLAGLTQAQDDALTALRNEVTETLAANAKDHQQSESQFASFNGALSTVETLFTTGQITELKIIGNYNPNTLNFADTWGYDEESNSYVVECAKGRICFGHCSCNDFSLCSPSCRTSPVCNRIADGCGCFWLWECNGIN